MAYKNRDLWRKDTQGKIQVSVVHWDDTVATDTLTFIIPQLTILRAKTNPSWQVRIDAHVVEKVRALMRKAGKKETGGLLLGLAHRKRQVIYVTDILPPSKDSKGTPYAFKRGVKDYPEIVDDVEAYTGGIIGYVGEWHTHPGGPAELSPTDHRAVGKIRKHLDSAGLPTHILVFGEREVASFVFSREEQSP
jgi:integrative and conjugative element protein (TIGR02256 family)